MKYTVRIKYQAESEIDVYASNIDEAEEEAANLLELNLDGNIISLDVMEVTENDDDPIDADDDDAYDLDDDNDYWLNPDDDDEDEDL